MKYFVSGIICTMRRDKNISKIMDLGKVTSKEMQVMEDKLRDEAFFKYPFLDRQTFTIELVSWSKIDE